MRPKLRSITTSLSLCFFFFLNFILRSFLKAHIQICNCKHCYPSFLSFSFQNPLVFFFGCCFCVLYVTCEFDCVALDLICKMGCEVLLVVTEMHGYHMEF